MHNTYIKELAVKSYQEEMPTQVYRHKQSRWHLPSFVAGLLMTLVINNLPV